MGTREAREQVLSIEKRTHTEPTDTSIHTDTHRWKMENRYWNRATGAEKPCPNIMCMASLRALIAIITFTRAERVFVYVCMCVKVWWKTRAQRRRVEVEM